MENCERAVQELIEENRNLKDRLFEAEQTIEAIRNGEVDALVIQKPEGEKLYTLTGADHGYRVLVESVSEGALILSSDNSIYYCNHTLGDMSGLPIKNIVGTKLGSHVVSEDRSHLLELIEKSRCFRDSRGEFLLKRTNGTPMPVSISLSSVSFEGFEGLCAIITDLSEQKQIEDELRKHRTELAQNEKLAAIGLLVSSIAHEINNPNNFIVFNLPILRDYIDAMLSLLDRHMEGEDRLDFFGMPYEEFRREVFNLLEDMELGSRRINVTVSELKDFSQKRDKLEAIPVDLKLTVERALAMCRSQLMKSVRSLDVDIPDTLPLILTDPKAVEQVLVNILSNASQAADKNDSWIKLRVLQEEGQDGCVIEVSDNGCGLEEQITEKIFEPFFTTKEACRGTGLGLYVCKTLMSALGGRIEVESQHGKGSTFRVVLGDSCSLPRPAG